MRSPDPKRLLPALLVLASTAHAAGTPPPAAALAKIDAAGLRARIRFLAHDLLEGRTGRGYDVAAAWVASELEGLGFEPAGENGTFFQEVPLARSRVEPVTMTVTGRGAPRRLEPPHVIVAPGSSVERVEVDADVVFGGYGIEAPRLGRDDYRGLDVRGKVVLVLASAPGNLPSDDRAHHGSLHQKELVAAAHGAAGLVHLLDVAPDAGYWRGATAMARKGAMRVVAPAGGPARELPFVGALDREGAARLLEGTGRTLADLQKSGRAGWRPGVRLAFSAPVLRERLSTRNVAGLLRGSDPRLAAETVVFTAHLDHLGVGGTGDDRIYNGAVDNASGVAGILEIAEAFAASPVRPPRSVLVLAVGAEELGLLGSEHFAANPTVPAASIVANVNVDMLPLQPALQPLREVVAFGAEHSSLQDVVRRGAAAVGLQVVADPMPEQRIFVRSDQYSFVKRGVPAVMLTAGGGGNWVEALKKWLEGTYHGVDDEIEAITDLSGGVTITQLSFRVGWEVATDPARPTWKPGSFFGETFRR